MYEREKERRMKVGWGERYGFLELEHGELREDHIVKQR